MSKISNRTRKLLSSFPWISNPIIVGAPMRILSGPKLAFAVSNAGGLGFIGPAAKTKDIIPDLEEASKLFTQARGAVFKSLPPTYKLLPVGVGFQLWNEDIEVAKTIIERFNPCVVWLYAPRNGQQDLDLWSRMVQEASPQTQVWVQIGTLAEIKTIIKSPRQPDVIVVQGSEAGGHGRAKDGTSLITLIPEVKDVMKTSDIPIFAAGGIADGRGALAALSLGASGIVLGTRFLASKEARINKGYQQEVVRANDGAVSTVRTLLYNHLRGTTGWPEEYSPRTIINKSWKEHEAGVGFDELKRLHDEALKAGESGWGPDGRLATYAGTSIGLIHEVKDAATIVHDIREDMIKRLDLIREVM